MFSDALRIMDQNAIEYMVDDLKAEKARLDSELSRKKSELLKKDSELSKKDSELLKKDSEIERLRTLLKQYEKGT